MTLRSVSNKLLHVDPKTLTFTALNAQKTLNVKANIAGELHAQSANPAVAIVTPATVEIPPTGPQHAQFTVTSVSPGAVTITITDADGDFGEARVTVAAAATWRSCASMPTPRYAFAAGAIDGKLYAAGGFGAGTLDVLERYDPASDTWTALASMPTARAAVMGGVAGHTLYVAGGLFQDAAGSQTVEDAVEAYDATNGVWAPRVPLPEPRHSGAAAVVNGILYVIGGMSKPPETLLATVLAYDPMANTWTARSSMPAPRTNVAAAVLDGMIYVVGGYDGNRYVDTVDAYDPSTDTWKAAAPLPSARGAVGAVVLNGVLYALGGFTPDNHYMNAVDAYIPATGMWTPEPPMQVAALSRGVAAIGKRLYAAGGWNNAAFSGALANTEAFEP